MFSSSSNNRFMRSRRLLELEDGYLGTIVTFIMDILTLSCCLIMNAATQEVRDIMKVTR